MSAPRRNALRRGWYGSSAQKRTVTLDDARRMSNSAWANSSRMITGLLLYTGLGWLVSLWVGHRALLMAIGAIVGLALSYYLVFVSLAHEEREDAKRQTAKEPSMASSERGMEEPGVS